MERLGRGHGGEVLGQKVEGDLFNKVQGGRRKRKGRSMLEGEKAQKKGFKTCCWELPTGDTEVNDSILLLIILTVWAVLLLYFFVETGRMDLGCIRGMLVIIFR